MQAPRTETATFSASFRGALLAVLALVFAVISIRAALGRSAWYDEYYTFYVSRPAQPFGAFWASAMRDNHPPLYYLLARAATWLGETIPPRRLVNLAFAALAALALWRIGRRRPALKPVLFAYAVGLAGASPVIVRMAELRSNFLAYALGAVTVAALAAFAVPHERMSRRATVALAATLALSFTVHLAATVILAAVAASFGLRLILARDWPGTARLALVGLVAALPFALCMAAQFGTISGNTRSFWIPGGFTVARWTIEMELIAGVKANPVLTVAGLAGLVLTGWRDLASRRLSPGLSLALTLGAGLALAIAALVAIHLERPFVIARYLICLHPVVLMILALGVATLAESLGRLVHAALDCALVIAALVSLQGQLQRTLALPGWDTSAAAIDSDVRACPATAVHAALDWNRAVLDLPPAENRAVVPFAYDFVAARHGFALEPPASRRMASGCPTLFWAEHVPGSLPDTATIAARLRQLGYPVSHGELARQGDGWIFTAR
ncbi:hypothetical protein H7F51_17835 [Novosphingobium flavum]|uniref:Glycosyltransferase RgtA/B/C/D-like domain-containing protein n=1 Tax=Novosphingobium flavum TaxID=1778672 RepID=A0A7X1FUU6_9SPHN|nr:hypothetical protein [Novosphingobium flavum]MBC2667383.1 hypothetical protein [Novosphingobium flavum]